MTGLLIVNMVTHSFNCVVGEPSKTNLRNCRENCFWLFPKIDLECLYVQETGQCHLLEWTGAWCGGHHCNIGYPAADRVAHMSQSGWLAVDLGGERTSLSVGPQPCSRQSRSYNAGWFWMCHREHWNICWMTICGRLTDWHVTDCVCK